MVCPNVVLRKTARGGLTGRIRGINPRHCCDAAANISENYEKGPCVTTAYTDAPDGFIASAGVYAPQEDSQFLIDVMEKTGLARGRRVADLCTGTGVGGDCRGRTGSVAGHGVRCVFAIRPVRADERRRAPASTWMSTWGHGRGPRSSARSTWWSATRRMSRTIPTSPCAPIPPDIGLGARMGCRRRRPPRSGPAVRGGARSAGSRRHFLVGAIGVRGAPPNTRCAGLRRTGRGSSCLPVDSVRSGAGVAGCLAGGHRQAGAGSARRRACGDQGGKTMTDNAGPHGAHRPFGAGDGAGSGAYRDCPTAMSWNPTGSWSRSAPAAAARTIRCAIPATGAVHATTRSAQRSS